jgi:hypothetical protein
MVCQRYCLLGVNELRYQWSMLSHRLSYIIVVNVFKQGAIDSGVRRIFCVLNDKNNNFNHKQTLNQLAMS